MDRLNQLRGEAGGSGDSTLDTSSPPSEAYLTANESSSKYFSLSEVDSDFDITPIKDVSLASASVSTERTITESDQLISNLSPINKKNDLLDSYKIGKQIEAANILSGGVDIFDDNDNSYDGDELIIDDNVDIDEKSNSELKMSETVQCKVDDTLAENVVSEMTTATKDTEVVLQIDGKNVDAIDIGNGLYLYRKDGEEELAVVQIIDDDQQQPSFKFLKVRENMEGNLEVYEEIQIEVPKEVPTKEKGSDKNVSSTPIKDTAKPNTETTSNKIGEKKKSPQTEPTASPSSELEVDINKESQHETKTEVNFNGKMKFSEARKSPVIGSYTPMTYHSTPNKEGIPLTKTMVDLQLHPSRHSDNIKKTIEVHTDSAKQRSGDLLHKSIKHNNEELKTPDSQEKDISVSQEENVTCEQKVEKVVEKVEKEERVDEKIVDMPSEEKLLVIDNEPMVKEDMEKPNKESAILEQINQKTDILQKEKETTGTDVDLEPVSNTRKTQDKNLAPETAVIVSNIPNENKNTISDKSSGSGSKEANEKDLDEKTKIIEIKDTTTVTASNKVDTYVEKVERSPPSSSSIVKPQNLPTVEVSQTKLNNDTMAASSAPETSNINVSLPIQTVAECKRVSEIKEKLDIKTSEPIKQLPSSSKSPKPEAHNIEEITPLKSPVQKCNDESKTIKNVETKINVNNIESPTNTNKEPMKSLFSKDTKIDLCTDNKDKKPETTIIETSKPVTQDRKEIDNKDIVKPIKVALEKPINNNHSAVPFGKWTEANRQEFLNKIKEAKVPTAASNGKQIKNSNDLNRRDVLKKIDSQRQTSIATAKAQEIANNAKLSVKKETAIFISKPSVIPESKIPVIAESGIKNKTIINKKPIKQEIAQKSELSNTAVDVATATKKEATQRKEINNQDLIDKTIEDIINRSVPVKAGQEEANQNVVKECKESPKSNQNQPKQDLSSKLDDIEMQMNKLHGIPLETPQIEPHLSPKKGFKTYSKVENEKTAPNRQNKVPNLIPFVNKSQQKVIKENTVEIDSDDEVIEHEPITGDIDVIKKSIRKLDERSQIPKPIGAKTTESNKKDPIITENDFDKFARRNSITYENCLKLNYDGSEKHNVIQTIIEKDNIKVSNKDDCTMQDNKTLPKHNIQNPPSTKFQSSGKLITIVEDTGHKSYHSSKVKMAYQSVMTAKRELERPITVIEDKPVKVVYVDSSMDYHPSNLNVQGKDLVPAKKHTPDIETAAVSSCDSLDSDILDSSDCNKLQDEVKTKSKHQRKQVLTPVDTPDIELIEPQDLGFDTSPKKKRKTDDNKIEKNTKALVPKKSYLLGRSVPSDDKISKTYESPKKSYIEAPIQQEEPVPSHNDAAASAIDSLVKAAALIETQSENIIKNVMDPQNVDSPVTTPVKRGRGRPRKYPLPEGENDKNKNPSPQKKPRLIDAKVKKVDNDTDEDDDDDSSGDEIVRENWTMGKINENIVCPICSKLFRSENVVFKHVKHCTGPSPNRSDSDKSPRRMRRSQESETRDSSYDETDAENINAEEKSVPKKRKSKETPKYTEKDDVIVIEDTPIKGRPEKRDVKLQEVKKVNKIKPPEKINNLVCEFCGKTFRQLSYLVSHKIQHANEDTKRKEVETDTRDKSVFSCEVCKKEFRKLHHLVQHRLIHNPSSMSSRLLRKSSSEQRENKIEKDPAPKQKDDPSAGFRCEPCDKSFRKLHHLVEHRETHDGINRQKNTSTTQTSVEKSAPQTPPPPQCDICKKTFRKLHHLIEHKEQHLETSSEQSDDKSVKSSLSTKDIIHECSLCYMVFPNEHSLTKHTVICQRKKRQSSTKPQKQTDTDIIEENVEVNKDKNEIDENMDVDMGKTGDSDSDTITSQRKSSKDIINVSVNKPQILQEIDKPQSIVAETKANEKEQIILINKDKPIKQDSNDEPKVLEVSEISKTKPTEEKEVAKEKVVKTPKKKISKEKIAPTVSKRQKTANAPLHVIDDDVKPDVESSDDDEVRYMLNPNFKINETSEEKLFMKVRAKKRSSLQIERPNSKDLIKRRISLQHPPKIPRLKAKAIESKIVSNNVSTSKVAKAPELDPVPFTDSDDSDVKYSFPKPAEKAPKASEVAKDQKKTQRKSLTEKRKSLGGIAKRKSIGKGVITKYKVNASPVKPIKKRTAEIEHRCDCGQLFSSAALLSRHTTLAHTPPRIRRRRSPAPDVDTKTVKPVPRKSSATTTRPSADSRKSSIRSEGSNSKPSKETRKSSVKSEVKNDIRKSIKAEAVTKSASAKPRRSAAPRVVPVPEKMRKLMEKNKK